MNGRRKLFITARNSIPGLLLLIGIPSAKAFECHSLPPPLEGPAVHFTLKASRDAADRYEALLEVEKFDLKCPIIPGRITAVENLVCMGTPERTGAIDCVTFGDGAEKTRHLRSKITFDRYLGHRYSLTITEEIGGTERYLTSEEFDLADCRAD